MVLRSSRRATPIHPLSDLLNSVCETMSTSVVNPFAFTEISRIRSMVRRPQVDATALARVRRDLFGPIDHDDTRKFVMRELAAQQALSSERWGFDFNREEPIRDGPGSNKYLWVKVTGDDTVPQAYSHEYTIAEETIISEDADVSAAAPTPPASPLEAATSTCPTATSTEEIHRSSKPAPLAKSSLSSKRTSLRRSMKRRRPDEVRQKKMTDYLRIRKSSSSLSMKAPKIRRLSDPTMSSAQRAGNS